MLMSDDFEEVRSPGAVIGSPSSCGAVRQGVDVEKTLSVDNNALRIEPLITPGWQRSGLAYGPFHRQAGLALSAFILNGHNASEGNSIEETLKGRFFRWLRGSETHSISYRLRQWVASEHHQHRVWHFYRWLRNHKRRFSEGEHLKENLSIGWFGEIAPDTPAAGNAITVRTAGAENGDLCTTVARQLSPALRGIQNLQTYYVVVLRERGAAYYAASLPNSYGLGAYPSMRLVGLDSHHAEKSLYAGIYQAALGQVGFRVDTRVYGVRAAVLPDLARWYGTACMADRLIGSESLEEGCAAETGQRWQIEEGAYCRTDMGMVGCDRKNVAIVQVEQPVGAVHVVIKTDEIIEECAVFWRSQDTQNTWALFLSSTRCQLQRCDRGEWIAVATDDGATLAPNAEHSVQILDTGSLFSLYLAGKLLFDRWFTDETLQNAEGVGLLCRGDRTYFKSIEAHPREILIPDELRISAPWEKRGAQVVLSESFSGDAGTPLNKPWQKTIGVGNMRLTGRNAARVEATPASPNPKRLAYTQPWPHSTFADVSVNILSPGEQRHEGHKGRGGLIFWQDAQNYLIVNHWLDDTFDGSAMSAFITIDGYEEIYDGVWANLGDRIAWGKQRCHRVTFDGLNFVVYVEEEPVLYRSIRDVYPKADALQINRIGIVANWEWGDDTGSEFSHFVASF